MSNLFYESDLRHFLLDESVLLAFLSVSGKFLFYF